MTLAEQVIDQARIWHGAGRPVVVATITRVRGSSSQPLGSRMAITDDDFVGYVSGGCVESDVCEQARRLFSDGAPRKLHYQQAGGSLFEIGLNCEGQIDVLLEVLSDELLLHLAALPPAIHVTAHRNRDAGAEEVRHTLLNESIDNPESPDPVISAAAIKARQLGGPVATGSGDGWIYLVEPARVGPTLLIVSASSVAHPLCALAKTLGYRVVVSDPRQAYLSAERFPDADLLLPVWPRELPAHIGFGPDVAIVSLNHEPRFEDDLFRTLQSCPAVAYIGAIGKRQRHRERVARQAEAGFDLTRLPLIHTPVGLDLGGKSPEEVALSIMSEILAARHGRPGGYLAPSGEPTVVQQVVTG